MGPDDLGRKTCGSCLRMEAVMRASCVVPAAAVAAKGAVVAAAVAAAVSVIAAQERIIDGSAMAIRAVVSGRTCVGTDVLNFGQSAPGASASFERVGRPAGTYAIGHGTIMIRR
jgi:hypothetical protein